MLNKAKLLQWFDALGVPSVPSSHDEEDFLLSWTFYDVVDLTENTGMLNASKPLL